MNSISKLNLPDIDIDVKDRNEVLKLFDGQYVEASMLQDGEFKKHPTGVFFQDVPTDPFSGRCVFPSGNKSGDVSDAKGLFKLDVIPNHGYTHVTSYSDLNEVLDMPVEWKLFEYEEVVTKLQHIGNHFDIVYAYAPKSLEDLACLIAIIRPAKRYLLGESWDVVKANIWKKEGDEYAFKKSHAFGFALMIVVQLNSMIKSGAI